MSKIYTIKHNQSYSKTSDTYKSNLLIVNKETLLYIASLYGLKLPKSDTKDKLAEALSTYVLSSPEKVLELLSSKELEVLKDFVKAGADTHVVRPNRKFYHTMRGLLLVSVCHNKQERKLYFLLPDELRELFAPLLDKQLKEARKREKAAKEASLKKPSVPVEEPVYLDDDDYGEDEYEGGNFDDDDEYEEEIIGISHNHYDSLGEFYLDHITRRDFMDNVLAVQEYHQIANVVDSRDAIITLYATVVYADYRTGEIIYRSEGPIEVSVDTEKLNDITIPDLPRSCVSHFSTQADEMHYNYGVLTILVHKESKTGEHAYVVSLV